MQEAKDNFSLAAVENSDQLVHEEIVRAWTQRKAVLQAALEIGDMSVIDYSNQPVPGYSPEAWARRPRELKEERILKASLDADDAREHQQLNTIDSPHNTDWEKTDEAGANPASEPRKPLREPE